MSSYFMQITSVDGEEFRIKLIPDKIETKQRRKFNVREIGKNTDLSEKIKIYKTKDSRDVEIDIWYIPLFWCIDQ